MVYVNGTLTVGQATLTVTAGNATRTYGAANPTFSATVSGAQGTDTFTTTESTTATAASPVGTYPIVPVATGANLANYTVVYVNGTLTVGQATLTVTAGNASRTYGAANPTFTATATGALGPDTFTFTESTTATATSPVGTYPIVPVATGANLANYTVVYVNGTLTVGQATLTVTAGNAARAYGAANPTFTATCNRSPPGRHLHLHRVHHRNRYLPGRHLPDRSCRHRSQPGQLHGGLRQRHPDRRPGYPDGHRRQRIPRLRRSEPDLHGECNRSPHGRYLHLHRVAPPQPRPHRSAPIRSFPSPPAPTWPTTPWSTSTAP